MEIYNETMNVLGLAAPSKTVVCTYTLKFKFGHTSSEDDPLSGHLKVATTPDIIKSYICHT